MPREQIYLDNLDADFARHIAGVVDAIEVPNGWKELVMDNVKVQPIGSGSKYRNAVVPMACTMNYGMPGHTEAKLKQARLIFRA